MSIIRNALRARGYQGLGVVALTALPLGLGALRRSQKIALAMEMRGFSYAEEMKIKRTTLKDIRFRPLDFAALGLMLAAVVLVLIA
jgi:energy-coupling factor transporter transmembrane protein EcfT